MKKLIGIITFKLLTVTSAVEAVDMSKVAGVIVRTDHIPVMTDGSLGSPLSKTTLVHNKDSNVDAKKTKEFAEHGLRKKASEPVGETLGLFGIVGDVVSDAVGAISKLLGAVGGSAAAP